MATQERIEQIRGFLDQWVEWRSEAVTQREKLYRLINAVKNPRNGEMVAVLQKQADAHDKAAREYDQCATYMQGQLMRAQNGEDV